MKSSDTKPSTHFKTKAIDNTANPDWTNMEHAFTTSFLLLVDEDCKEYMFHSQYSVVRNFVCSGHVEQSQFGHEAHVKRRDHLKSNTPNLASISLYTEFRP